MKNSKKKKLASQLAKLATENKKRLRKKEQREKKQQRKIPIPFLKDKEEFEMYKQSLQPMLDEANDRIEKIKSQGYTSYAIDTLENSTGRDYFTLDGTKTKEDLIREITRIRAFIADSGSTIEGAILQTAEINAQQYKGKFGNQYHNLENHFKNFDIKAIDEDVAKRVFANYRRIESTRASQIVKEGSYGSENLIMVMYDAEIRGLDSLEYGMDILSTFVKTQTQEYETLKLQADAIASISGKLLDNITGGYQF